MTKTTTLLRSKPLDQRIAWVSVLLLAFGAMLSTALAQISSVVILSVFLFVLVRQKGRVRWSDSVLDIVIPLMALARIMSIFFSVDPQASLLTLRVEIPFYLLVFAFVWVFRSAEDTLFIGLIRLLAAGAVIAAIVGIFVYASGLHHRARSVTSGYYTLGMYLTAIFGLVLGIGKRKEYFGPAVLWYGILSLLLVGILFTFNRIHWVIAASMVLLMGFYRDRRFLFGLVVLGGVAALASEPLRERILSMFGPTASLSDRDVLWSEGMKLLGDRPLTGFGTRTFKSIFEGMNESMDPGVASWHSDMLQIYVESGIVALVGYILLLFAPLTLVLRSIVQKGRDTDPRLVGFGLVIFAVFLGGLTGIFFTDPIIMPLVYMSISVVVVVAREERDEGKGQRVNLTDT